MSRGDAGLSVSAGLALLFALVGGLYVGWRHLQRIRSGEVSYIVRALRGASASRAVHAIGGRWDLGGRFIRWWEHLLEGLAEAFVGRNTFWPAMGVSLILLVTILVTAATFAFGTLIYTVSAIALAPQVVMFVGLTRATMGLDHVRPGGRRAPDHPRARLSPGIGHDSLCDHGSRDDRHRSGR